MKTVGIVGFGSFGKFLAEKLSSHAKVRVYSHGGTESSWSASLLEVAQSDYVVLAIPLDGYEKILFQIKPLLLESTVVIDVCSVKVVATAVLKRLLPDQPRVVTHPMFGPESASIRVTGHTMVMCPSVSDQSAYAVVKEFVASLGITVIEMTPEEHDRQIATVQGLTFFIARALKDMKLNELQLSTPSFRRLLHLAELEQHHSDQLFQTVQLGNPYTMGVRQQFLAQATHIDDMLHKMVELSGGQAI